MLFRSVGMAKKFMQTVLVADALSELQRANLETPRPDGVGLTVIAPGLLTPVTAIVEGYNEAGPEVGIVIGVLFENVLAAVPVAVAVPSAKPMSSTP